MSGRQIVVGVDIVALSPQASRQPRFAAVILDGNNVVERFSEISLRRLLRLLKAVKPSMIAVDNIYELAPNSKSLLKFIHLLPKRIKLVQVTGSPKTGFQSLEGLAAKHGIFSGGKLSPLQAAEAAARLASMGIGFEVCVYEEETRITVSRGRSVGSGGMSQARYQRSLQTLILRATREIESRLRAKGFDYDLVYRRTVHGLEGSTFIVYASRDKLHGVVRPAKGHDLRITITPVFKREIEFKPLSSIPPAKKHLHYLIVGVDPGMVTGLAALDLNGRLVLLTSGRGLSRGRISRILAEHGYPLVVASDVHPPPELVAKLGSMHDAVVYTPGRLLTTSEKQELVHEFCEKHEGVQVEDSHQRDALAAAIKAYNSFKSKLEQCEAHVRETGLKLPLDEIKALVVKGKSIREAITACHALRAEEPKPTPAPPPKPSSPEIGRLVQEVKSLEAEKSLLEEQVKLLQQKVSSLEEAIEQMRREERAELLKDREIYKAHHEMTLLREQLQQLRIELETTRNELKNFKKLFHKAVKEGLIFLKPIRSLHPSSLSEAIEEFGLKSGDVLYVHDLSSAEPSAVEILSELKVQAIIAGNNPPPHVTDHLLSKGIPIISSSELEITWIHEIPAAPPEQLNQLISARKSTLEEKLRRRARENLLKLIEEYRRERMKEFQED